jgi:hypothetical protein
VTVQQVRELICDCRQPACRGDAPSCCTAIADYADSHGQIRAIGARQGWSWIRPGQWKQRDYCPACVGRGCATEGGDTSP